MSGWSKTVRLCRWRPFGMPFSDGRLQPWPGDPRSSCLNMHCRVTWHDTTLAEHARQLLSTAVPTAGNVLVCQCRLCLHRPNHRHAVLIKSAQFDQSKATAAPKSGTKRQRQGGDAGEAPVAAAKVGGEPSAGGRKLWALCSRMFCFISVLRGHQELAGYQITHVPCYLRAWPAALTHAGYGTQGIYKRKSRILKQNACPHRSWRSLFRWP